MTIAIRPARTANDSDMAVLVDIAGHGLPAFPWGHSRGANDPDPVPEVGRSRVLRDGGSFSWRNAVMAEIDGQVAGMLTGYRRPDAMDDDNLDALDPLIRPLVELETLAPSTWSVNMLAAHAGYRGQGIGSVPMVKADEPAAGCPLSSKTTNVGARRSVSAAIPGRGNYR